MTDPSVAAIVDNAVVRAQRASPALAASLLVDAFACARNGSRHYLQQPGLFAAAAHSIDLDDVHWPTLTHPGSIVWPATLFALTDQPLEGRAVLRAGSIGYEVTASFARLFEACGVTAWHRTSIAGQVGAAAAAARMTGTSESAAAALALTMVSGVGQTMLERASSSQYHRACAARNGIDAAVFVGEGVEAPSSVLTGPAGALVALGVDREAAFETPPTPPAPAAIDETTIRPFATNGFAQAAVEAARQLSAKWVGAAARITVVVHPLVAGQFASPPTPHWDLLAAVGSTWNEMRADAQVDADDLMIEPDRLDDLAVGDARVTISRDHDQETVRVERDFAHPGATVETAFAKWRWLGVKEPESALESMTSWLGSADKMSVAELSDLV